MSRNTRILAVHRFLLATEVTAALNRVPIVVFWPQIEMIYQLNELARIDPQMLVQVSNERGLLPDLANKLRLSSANPTLILKTLMHEGVRHLVFIRGENFPLDDQVKDLRALAAAWQQGFPQILMFSGHRLDVHLDAELQSGAMEILGAQFALTHQLEISEKARVLTVRCREEVEILLDNRLVQIHPQNRMLHDFYATLLLQHHHKSMSQNEVMQLLSSESPSGYVIFKDWLVLREEIRKNLERTARTKVPPPFEIVAGSQFIVGSGYTVRSHLDEIEQALYLHVNGDLHIAPLKAVAPLIRYQPRFLTRPAMAQFRRRYAYAAAQLNLALAAVPGIVSTQYERDAQEWIQSFETTVTVR